MKPVVITNQLSIENNQTEEKIRFNTCEDVLDEAETETETDKDLKENSNNNNNNTNNKYTSSFKQFFGKKLFINKGK